MADMRMNRGSDRCRIIREHNLPQDVAVHRLRSCIGAMLASSGGLDTLVFHREDGKILRSFALLPVKYAFDFGSSRKKA